MFNFLRNCHTVFQSSYTVLHFLYPIQFLHILTKTSYAPRPFFLSCGHHGWYEVVSHCGFDLCSLVTYDVEYLFMCLLVICISPLEKYVSNPLLILKSSYFSFYCSVVSVLYIFCRITPYQIYDLQIFSFVL